MFGRPRHRIRKAKERRHGGGAYTASAVHFDGLSWLSIATLGATNNAFFSGSFWMLAEQASGVQTILVSDPDGNYIPSFGFGSVDADVFLSAVCGQVPANRLTIADNNGPFLNYANWHHVLFAFDGATQTGKVYIDDVDYGDLSILGAAFTFAMNAKAFVFAGDTFEGDGVIGDMADVWLAPGVNLMSAGVIPEVTRRKFISAAGKPVNLGANGETPTGTAPRIFFTGDATEFATNQGSGGAFTLTGALTNASSSPSD